MAASATRANTRRKGKSRGPNVSGLTAPGIVPETAEPERVVVGSLTSEEDTSPGSAGKHFIRVQICTFKY